MVSQTERLKQSMFRDQGDSVVNVKFFLGGDRKVTGDQLTDQLARADAQMRAGTATRSTQLDGDLAFVAI